MARASKPEMVEHQSASKQAPRARRTVRRLKRAPETTLEPVAAEPGSASVGAQPSAAEVTAIEPPAAGASEIEATLSEPAIEALGFLEPVSEAEAAPIASSEPASTGAAPEPVIEPAPARPAAAAVAVAAPVLHEVQRLHGVTLSYWRAQLERTMATGRAIMVCRSHQAAFGLQVGYLQATLASGFEHASDIARLSQDIARDMLASRLR